MTKSSKKSLLDSQLGAAAEIWELIQNDKSPADRWLGNYFHKYRKKYGSRDRRFLSETIYALFRHKSFLNEWAKHLKSPEDAPLLAFMAAASEGLIPLSQFEQVSPQFFQSQTSLSTIYASLQHRELPPSVRVGSPEEELALKFSFPLWLVKRWIKFFGVDECLALLGSFQERPPLVVRANSLKMTRERLIARFRKKGYSVQETARSSSGIFFSQRVSLFDGEEFQKGFFEIQDEGSQIICQMIDPKPTEVVWDVCAGGGGKSLALAALMGNKGRIIATDIRERKLEDLKKRARRAGVYNIFPADLSRLEEAREIKKGVDKILIDAPCSGTGTLRRNPDAKWKLSEDKFALFHRDQVAIIEKALPYLKKGGKLYYVTCSLEPDENEEVMKEIFSRHTELGQIRYPVSRDGFYRLLPHKHQTDGFFLGMAENKL